MLLAIDTSTAVASVALFGKRPNEDREGIAAENTWRAGQRHTTQLLPQVENMLALAELKPLDLTAIAVALGPGSFNGLRVGIATAKLLAHSLGLPLVGISTLEAAAYGFREAAALASLAAGAPAYVRPVHDAGRGQIATALYRSSAFERESPNRFDLVEVEQPRLTTLADIFSDAVPFELAAAREPAHSSLVRTDESPLLAFAEDRAEDREEWAAEMRRRGDRHVLLVSPTSYIRRAGPLAELAWHRLQAGETAEPASLRAIYLRRPLVLEGQRLPELD